MKEFEILYLEGKSDHVNKAYVTALTKGLAEEKFKKDYDYSVIIGING